MRQVPILHFPQDILSWTDHWIAVNKPSGLPSRPNPGHADNALSQIETWFFSTTPLSPAPGVVHRLDRDTSGVLIFSLGPAAYRSLIEGFAARTIRKEYVALVQGVPRPRSGLIDLPLLRNSSNRMVVDRRGQEARTRYEMVRRVAGGSLLRVYPLTGRMHQIRAHLAARGTPVLGDGVYGREGRAGAGTPFSGVEFPPRLCLHARRLTLPSVWLSSLGSVQTRYPTEGTAGAPFIIEAPIPQDLNRYMAALTQGRRE
jgi:RluA family pseudouridine synthase